MPDSATPEPAEIPVDVLIAGMERIRAGTFRGRDRDRLVTATVDGDGLVVRVAFSETVRSRDRRVVESAVREALRAAQKNLFDAYGRLVATGSTEPLDAEAGGSTVDEPPMFAIGAQEAPPAGGALPDPSLLEER
ncbi:MAG: YbaB/EbfC family nucleoid-associated protein [Micromonosporaceae bacterium]|nr:YbaB/EbfC family nucleoid-associated protein [Micromonosporaceae bacterium]